MTGPPREDLRDGTGAVVATFVRGTRDGHPLADDLEPVPGVPLGALAAQIAQELPGHIVGAPTDLGEALVALGAQPRRRVRVMLRDLPGRALAVPPAPDDVRMTTVGAHAARDLAPVFAAAYPPGHPDHRPGDARAQLEALVGGAVIGPLLACSRIARDAADGTALGAALVFDHPGEPPLGGPWVGELFRHPAAPRATGTALLAAAIQAAGEAGLHTLGLVVTDGNPALRVYERLGFVVVRRFLAVLVA